MTPRRVCVAVGTAMLLAAISLTIQQAAVTGRWWRPRPIVAILCGPVPSLQRHHSYLQTAVIPSIVKTVSAAESAAWDVRLYLGVESSDAVRLRMATDLATPPWLAVNIVAVQTGGTDGSPYNALARRASRDGAEYLVRINEATEFATTEWITAGVQALRGMSPPNIGVVGATLCAGKEHVVFATFKNKLNPNPLRRKIEQNTRRGWSALHPRVHTIWFNDADVDLSPHGTPLLKSMYDRVPGPTGLLNGSVALFGVPPELRRPHMGTAMPSSTDAQWCVPCASVAADLACRYATAFARHPDATTYTCVHSRAANCSAWCVVTHSSLGRTQCGTSGRCRPSPNLARKPMQ